MFTVTITDPRLLAGIAAAHDKYNKDNPDTPIATDEDYVQFVMASAAASYAKQYLSPA